MADQKCKRDARREPLRATVPGAAGTGMAPCVALQRAPLPTAYPPMFLKLSKMLVSLGSTHPSSAAERTQHRLRAEIRQSGGKQEGCKQYSKPGFSTRLRMFAHPTQPPWQG